MSDYSTEPTRPPLSRLAGVFGGGATVGAVLSVALLAGSDAQEATSTAFALGALVFGAALLGWTAAIMAGPGLEATISGRGESRFSEAGARRAMLLLCAIGFGVMVGSSLLAAVLV